MASKKGYFGHLKSSTENRPKHKWPYNLYILAGNSLIMSNNETAKNANVKQQFLYSKVIEQLKSEGDFAVKSKYVS